MDEPRLVPTVTPQLRERAVVEKNGLSDYALGTQVNFDINRRSMTDPGGLGMHKGGFVTHAHMNSVQVQAVQVTKGLLREHKHPTGRLVHCHKLHPLTVTC